MVWTVRPGGERIPLFSQSARISKINKPQHLCQGFCGVGRPRRVGGTDLNVLQSLPFFKIKTPDITVGGFVVWAGIPACRQAGNQLMCFRNQYSFRNQKTPTLLSGFLWCGPGSNRRHKDFQSFALPTELPHHSRSNMKSERGANIRTCGFIQILSTKFFLFELFSSFYQLHIPCHYHSNLILTNFSAPVELIRA